MHREKEEIEGELKKKENPTKEEKETLEKKEKEYKKRFQEAKDKTTENIENQLKENKLNITELDDKKSLSQRILRDPLKFFIVSPLNKTSKLLGLQEGNHPFWKTSLEIILKLSIIEIILVLIYYSETIIVWENMEKIRDPHLSVEEKEQLSAEASPLVKYMFFNGLMSTHTEGGSFSGPAPRSLANTRPLAIKTASLGRLASTTRSRSCVTASNEPWRSYRRKVPSSPVASRMRASASRTWILPASPRQPWTRCAASR